MKKKWLIAAVCALALVLTACSGGGQGETTQAPAETSTAPAETSTAPAETTEPAAQLWETNVLRSDEIPRGPVRDSEYLVFGSGYQRKHIQSVTFLDTLADAPTVAWDVSDAENGAVLAWVESDEELYDLYIGAEGGVWANESCKELFSGYTNVERITFGEAFHTSNVRDMSYMFAFCDLEELDLSSFDTSNVQDMSWMFENCEGLTSLDLSSFNTANVVDMSAMFDCCFYLKELNLSSFDTSNVQDMSIMFDNCCNLKSLDLSNFDTSSVENMEAMFASCYSLRELDVSSFNTSNVKYIEAMFMDCNKLEELDLNGFDVTNVKDMYGNDFDMEDFEYMFRNCPAGSDWHHLVK